MVVVCADGREPRLAREALDHGIHYVDITADLARLEQLVSLSPVTLPSTLDVPTVGSWLALRPAVVGYLASAASRSPLRRLLRRPAVRDLLVGGLVLAGTDDAPAGAVVEAHGLVGRRRASARASIAGPGQSATTALVVARVVQDLMRHPRPPGVFHLEQLGVGAALLETLRGDGLAGRPRRVTAQVATSFAISVRQLATSAVSPGPTR